MSVRSELRAAALERSEGQCEWPGDYHERRLELAHLVQLSQGGPDLLDNTAILCKRCHDVLDSRLSWSQARPTVLALLDGYSQALRSLPNHHASTSPQTDTLSTAGASPHELMSKLSNTGSSTDESRLPDTSTTETAIQQTTDPKTYNPSTPQNIDANIATSTMRKRGVSTSPAYPQSKSANGSAATPPLSAEDSAIADTNSATPVRADDSTLIPAASLHCFWPGSLHNGSVRSSEYPIHRYVASSAIQEYSHVLSVDLCDRHSDLLDNRAVLKGRRQSIMELLDAYLRAAR